QHGPCTCVPLEDEASARRQRATAMASSGDDARMS
ncbi:hsp70 family protein, partial [Vibrio parahaemolyticus EKP-021]